MERQWDEFWRKSGAAGDREAAWRDLRSRYEEPHRRYHTLRHIEHCFAELDAVRGLLNDAIAVELAVWFHDAIYDPARRDNEERSAELALGLARAAGITEPSALRAAAMIRASAFHRASGGGDEPLFLDADLSILGQPAAAFELYENQIREEFSFVAEPEFRMGRAWVVRSFLDRPAIYATEFFRGKYEVQARNNLTGSLKRWR